MAYRVPQQLRPKLPPGSCLFFPCSLYSKYSHLYTHPSIISDVHSPLRYPKVLLSHPLDLCADVAFSSKVFCLSRLNGSSTLSIVFYSLALTTIWYTLCLPLCLLYCLPFQPSPPSLQGYKLPVGEDVFVSSDYIGFATIFPFSSRVPDPLLGSLSVFLNKWIHEWMWKIIEKRSLGDFSGFFSADFII